MLCVIAIAGLFAARYALESPAVKARLIAELRNAIPGEVGWQRLDVAFLPWPKLEVVSPSWVDPSSGELRARRLEIRPALPELLFGKVRIEKLRIQGARALLILPPSHGNAARFSPARFELPLRAALDRLATVAPGVNVEAVDGELTVRFTHGRTLVLAGIDAYLTADATQIALRLRATSSAIDRIEAALRLARATRQVQFELQLGGTRLAGLSELLPVRMRTFGMEGDLDARLIAKSAAVSHWVLELEARAARLGLDAAREPITLQGAALKASAEYAPGKLMLVVSSLRSNAPSLSASGSLRAQAGNYALAIDAQPLALNDWLPLFDALAPESSGRLRTHAVVHGGTLLSMHIDAVAPSMQMLLAPGGMTASAQFENLAVDLPPYGIAVRAMAGTMALCDGVLHIDQVRGDLGASRIRHADVSLRLSGADQTLRGRIDARVQLADALRIARRAFESGPMHNRLAAVQSLDGVVVARVELSGTPTAPSAAVTLSEPALSIRHAALPEPLGISGGTARYAAGILSVQGLAGRFGTSAFHALTGTLGVRAPFQLRLSGGNADLGLHDVQRWLARQAWMGNGSFSLQGGRARVSLASVEGQLSEPGRMRYRIDAVPIYAAIAVRALEDTIRLNGGVLTIEPDAFSATDVTTVGLGSSGRLGGRVERIGQRYRLRELKVSGTLQQPLLDWLSARGLLPARLRPVVPLRLDGVRVHYAPDASILARGALQSTEGTRLEFDVLHRTEGSTRLHLALRDAQSDARISGVTSRQRWRVKFEGSLAADSIRRLLPDQTLPFRSVSGDMALDFDRAQPLASRAQGRLAGERVELPGVALQVERFALQADGQQLRIDSASIGGPGNEAVFSGTVNATQDRYLVDLRLEGKSLAIPFGKTERGKASADRRPTLQIPSGDLPVWGSVRANLERVRIGDFDVIPMIATGKFENGRLDLEVERATLCGVTLQGKFIGRPNEASVEGTLRSRGAPVQEIVPCLTRHHVVATGVFDMDARFAAQAPVGSLLAHMKGEFNVAAHDGQIVADEWLNRVFGAVNVTEVAHGRLPDLRKASMAFYTVRMKGRLDGWRLLIDEALLDASNVALAARGDVDLAMNTVNLQVLVAPLKTVNAIVRRMPILGRMLGATAIAVPVQVSGPMSDPQVVPFGSLAILTPLVDIMRNTLALPVKLLNRPGGLEPSPAPK